MVISVCWEYLEYWEVLHYRASIKNVCQYKEQTVYYMFTNKMFVMYSLLVKEPPRKETSYDQAIRQTPAQNNKRFY